MKPNPGQPRRTSPQAPCKWPLFFDFVFPQGCARRESALEELRLGEFVSDFDSLHFLSNLLRAVRYYERVWIVPLSLEIHLRYCFW